MKVRVVSTASKSKAVQVVNYHNYKRVILKHIGSARSKEELEELITFFNKFKQIVENYG